MPHPRLRAADVGAAERIVDMEEAEAEESAQLHRLLFRLRQLLLLQPDRPRPLLPNLLQ